MTIPHPVKLRPPQRTLAVDNPFQHAPSALGPCAFKSAFFATNGPNDGSFGFPGDTPFGVAIDGHSVGLRVESSSAGSSMFDIRGFGLVRNGQEIAIAVAAPSVPQSDPDISYLPTTYNLRVKRIAYSQLDDPTAGNVYEVNETYELIFGTITGGLSDPNSLAFWSPGSISDCCFDDDGRMYQWVISDVGVFFRQFLGSKETNLINPPTMRLKRYELISGVYQPVAVLAELHPTPYYTEAAPFEGGSGDTGFPFDDPALRMWALSWNPYDGLLYTTPLHEQLTSPALEAATDVIHTVDPDVGGLTAFATAPTQFGRHLGGPNTTPPPRAMDFAFTADGAVWYDSGFYPEGISSGSGRVIRLKGGGEMEFEGIDGVTPRLVFYLPIPLDRGELAGNTVFIQVGTGFGFTDWQLIEGDTGPIVTPRLCNPSLNQNDHPYPYAQWVATAKPGSWSPSMRFPLHNGVGLTLLGTFGFSGQFGRAHEAGFNIWRLDDEAGHEIVPVPLGGRRVRAPDYRPVVIRKRGRTP